MSAQAYVTSTHSTPFAGFVRVAGSLAAILAFGFGMADLVVRPGTGLGDALASIGLGVSDAPAMLLLEAAIYSLALLPLTALAVAMVTSRSTLVAMVQERPDLAITVVGAVASVLLVLVHVDGMAAYPLYVAGVYVAATLFARLLAGDW